MPLQLRRKSAFCLSCNVSSTASGEPRIHFFGNEPFPGWFLPDIATAKEWPWVAASIQRSGDMSWDAVTRLIWNGASSRAEWPEEIFSSPLFMIRTIFRTFKLESLTEICAQVMCWRTQPLIEIITTRRKSLKICTAFFAVVAQRAFCRIPLSLKHFGKSLHASQ